MDEQFLINIGFGSVIYVVCLVSSLITFCRRNREPIKSRDYVISLYQAVVICTEISLRIAGKNRIGCFVELARVLMFTPVWAYPFFIRCFYLWLNFNMQSNLVYANAMANTMSHSSASLPSALTPAFFLQLSDYKINVLRWFQRRGWIRTTAFKLGVCLVIFILSLGLSALIYFQDATSPSLQACQTVNTFKIVLAEAFLSIVLVIFYCYVLWHVRDAYRIKLELLIILFIAIPLLGLWATSYALNWQGMLSSNVWLNLIELILTTVTFWIPIFASYRFSALIDLERKRLQRDSSSNLSPNDEFLFCLQDRVLLSHFQKFATESWSVENLLFYQAVEEFKKGLPKDLVERAEKIYHEYIDLDAPCEINIDMKMRSKIRAKMIELKQKLENNKNDNVVIETVTETDLCLSKEEQEEREGGNEQKEVKEPETKEDTKEDVKKEEEEEEESKDKEIFDEAAKHALDLLQYSVFPLWKGSQDYKDLLKKVNVQDLMELKMLRNARKLS